jgi:hypothetical protein
MKKTVNKYLVYVEKFKSKQELADQLEEGRVYPAVDDGELINIMLENGNQFLVHKTVQSGDAFDAKITTITKENQHQFTYTQSDSELVIKELISPIVEKAAKEYQKQQHDMVEDFGDKIADLTIHDPEIVEALADVVTHIHTTYADKYEVDMFPAIDLYGLMRSSPHGKGYNIGNASKYLKRYLTEGFEKSGNPQDIMKAIHYLIFEITRLNNLQNDKG